MEKNENILNMRMRVGTRIRNLRKNQHLSQYQFSRMIGMDRTYLIGVEKGRRNISLDNLSKIAQGLDVPLSSLFIDVEMQDRD